MPLAGVRVRVRPQRWLILPQGLRTVERLHILAKLTGISCSKFRLLRKHVSTTLSIAMQVDNYVVLPCKTAKFKSVGRKGRRDRLGESTAAVGC